MVRSRVAYPPVLSWLDAWRTADPRTPPDLTSPSAHDAMRLVEDPAIRAALAFLLETGARHLPPTLAPLLVPLAAYARALECRGVFDEAAPLYAVVAAHAEEPADWRLLADAHLRIGHCHLALSLFDAAETSFGDADLLATRWECTVCRLRARLGLAFVADRRGDLVRADTLCCAIVTEAVTPELRAIRATTLLHLAVVRYERGQWLSALALAYLTFPLTRDPEERGWILLTVAALMLALERWEVTRHTLQFLLQTTGTHAVRSRARVGLVVLAARQGTAEDLTAALAAVIAGSTDGSTDVLDAADAYVAAARGYLRLGDPSRAEISLAAGHQLINAHDLPLPIQTLDTLPAEAREVAARPALIHAPLEPDLVLNIIETLLRTLPIAHPAS